MYDVITLGDIDALIEVSKREKVGKLIHGDISIKIGGEGAKFSLFASKLKLKVALIACIPDNFIGKSIVENLKEINVIGKKVNSCSIMLKVNGSIIYSKGSNEKLSIKDFNMNLFKKSKHFHRTGLFKNEKLIDEGSNKRIMSFASLYNSTSLSIKWNGNKKEAISLFPFSDILFLNEYVAKKISGKRDLNNAIKFFRRKANLSVIYLKNGCLLVKKTRTIKFEEKNREKLFCQEAFSAGFIYGYLKGFSLEDCCRIANFTSFYYNENGKIPNVEEIKDKLKL